MLGMVPLALLLVLMWSTDSEARRIYITPEQKSQLSQIQTIWVSALALSEKGLAPHGGILEVVQRRFEELGSRVVSDAADSYDVEFHVVCEERKREQGITRYGGDAELKDAPDRLWHGPACQLSYRLNGRDLGWYKEVHATIDEMPLMTEEIQASEHSIPAFDQLVRELEHFDFPVMLLSEWGHTHRLVVLLTDPETSQTRELLILDLLRLVPASEALPYFLKLIQEGPYAEEAIYALSGLGHESIPYLLELFADRDKDPPIRAAAAKGLGRIMRAEGDPDVRGMLLEYVSDAVARITSSADIEFPVLTEVVWAIGSIHHKATFQLINTLQSRLWLIYDTSPEMKKLRDVVSVVHRYMDLVQL